jgi:NAD-dependent dihydropyrimidine dehydrogenase PreA subunit
MTTATKKLKRKIVKIDEEKCDGCGSCVIACAEGALKIIDGKAKLISEKYCDGLGACLGDCPQDAIIIEERDADEFNEEAVKHHLAAKEHNDEKLPCGCPSTTVTQFERKAATAVATDDTKVQESMLGHWPVQLTLVPVNAPFLRGADLVLAAHCTPFAYAGFHRDFLKNHALLIACPKLDDFSAHQAKLTEIMRHSGVKSVTVVRMEVPCCSGLTHMVKEAISTSGNDIPLSEVIIGVKGDLKS